jgi:hypothetical protein
VALEEVAGSSPVGHPPLSGKYAVPVSICSVAMEHGGSNRGAYRNS